MRHWLSGMVKNDGGLGSSFPTCGSGGFPSPRSCDLRSPAGVRDHLGDRALHLHTVLTAGPPLKKMLLIAYHLCDDSS